MAFSLYALFGASLLIFNVVCVPAAEQRVARDAEGIDAFLGKSYKLYDSQNFNEFMNALGVGFWTRQGANFVSPSVVLTKEGDEYRLSTTSTFKSQFIKFKPGVQFDETTLDGRDVKSTITFEGNKMIHKSEGEKKSEIIREYTPQEMKAILKVDDVVSTRLYRLE